MSKLQPITQALNLYFRTALIGLSILFKGSNTNPNISSVTVPSRFSSFAQDHRTIVLSVRRKFYHCLGKLAGDCGTVCKNKFNNPLRG
jgi:hypothetical protein